MSGIFGFIHRADTINRNNIRSIINGMHIWNKVYGLDDEGILIKDFFGIGCCTQKINNDIKVSTVISKGNVCAVMDAVIYNREEIISHFSNIYCIQKEISDEELLFRYIMEFGLDSLKEVNGDFAGALVDKDKDEVILFRDHLGVRPLFYLLNDQFFAFSTDIRGLTGIIEANVSLRDKWIYDTLIGHEAEGIENTEYNDLYCVRPGSYLTIKVKERHTIPYSKPYWKLGTHKIKKRSDKEYQKQLKELITDAVKRRINVVSGRIGAELSGGLDSSVIGILINRCGKKCVYSSWSYPIEIVPLAEQDERLIIADICKQENITCNYEKIGYNGSFFEKYLLEQGLYDKNDSDLFFGCAFPSYLNTVSILETAIYMKAQGINVVFSGHGGDEGVSHRSNPYEMFYHKEYYRYFRYMFSTTKGSKHRVINAVRRIKKDISDSRKVLKEPYISMEKAPELMNESFRYKYIENEGVRLSFAYDSVKYIEDGGSRNRLDVIALYGAYSGVRYMVPYLDYRVLDYAVSIPRYQYLRGRRNRYIFREAFKDIMPDSLYKLKTKEELSHKNYKSDPAWGDKFVERKKEIVSRFDPKKWEKYLDLAKLEEYSKEEKPANNNATKESLKLSCLTKCLMAQNVIDKSRKISGLLKEQL